MSQQYRIAIAGMGGVGGFYGSLLAKAYENSPEVIVNFVARGNHMQAIKDSGLKLEKDSGDVVARPHHITDSPEELGRLDLIIFCCKGYDLEKLALSFADNITEETVLLPLLNGVGSTEVLQRLFPEAKTLYGCTYLVSKIIADGVVKMTGELNHLFFGSPDFDRSELERIKSILSAAAFNVTIPDDIKLKLWEKFSFISPMATATSALNSSVDAILTDDSKRAVLGELMREIVLLSKYEGVKLPDDIIEANMGKMAKLPAGATSSMHNDFKNNKNTELEMLTGYVVKEAAKYGVDVPAYEREYAALRERAIA